jgi:serine/threonine-protein kinase
MLLQLYVVSGPDKGRSFPLSPGETLQVGRSQATATKLNDPTVSRVHCEIEYDAGRARPLLVNISSSGTLVNGHAVSQHELELGDVVKVGNTELRVRNADGSEASTIHEKVGGPATPRPGEAGPSAAALAGQTLSNYHLETVLAKGAAGVVYKAKDTATGQAVAVKVLKPEFATNEEEMQRFIRGMKVALPLRHPNLVTLHKAGRTGVFCWMAMDLIEGESMTDVIRRIGVAGMLDWRYGFKVAVHIARVLDYAHGQHIIHRNVAPQNILWRTADKTALLGDLMFAKALEGTLAQQITTPGELVGDVSYMAPERTRGGEVDGRSDLYGLGATVYALIAGRPPFSGGTMLETISRIRTAEPEKPKKYQMAIPDLFQGTVLKLLAKRPEDRFQSAKELLTDLERVGKFAGVSV